MLLISKSHRLRVLVPFVVCSKLAICTDELSDFWITEDSSAVVLLLVCDVAHDHCINGHVEHVHEHSGGHVSDGHDEHSRGDEVRHLQSQKDDI
jgi:hypothetical protein